MPPFVILDPASWALIIGLACLLVGGLLLWIYGLPGRHRLPPAATDAAEIAPLRLFLAQVSGGLAVYGLGLLLIGITALLLSFTVAQQG